MTKQNFPIQKSDVHYDASSDEVTLKRDKFEAFVKYAHELMDKLEEAEDAGDVQRYRTRRAEQTGNVLQALTEDVLQGTAAVRRWLELPEHTIRELSTRTGIPYATCHRIVNERLGTPNVEIGYFKKMVGVVLKDMKGKPLVRPEFPAHYRRVLLGIPKGEDNMQLARSFETTGSEVTTVHAGTEVPVKIGEVHPDLVLLDVFMPSLGRNIFEELGKFAKDTKSTIIFTGETAEATTDLVRSLSEQKTKREAIPQKLKSEAMER
jgi:CheY-like chemotaxis protein